jgi:hypothetical protein
MTGRVLTVALDPADAAASRLHGTVLASLPARFRAAPGSAADVVLVSGDQAGWLARARSAVGSGARAIVLTGTLALTADRVRQLAREASDAGLTVVADSAYAADPGWVASVPLLAADLAGAAVLDSVITRPEPGSPDGRAAALRSALTGQLALIRSLLTGLGELKPVHVSGRDYIIAGVEQDIAVTLAGTVSGAGTHRLDLDLAGSGRHWQASFAADALAFPARISASDADGELVLPPVYQSAHRAVWASLHAALGQETAVRYAADELAGDLALAEAALGRG